MIMSLVLSYVIGIAFGAQGLIAMGAGVISTILSYPGYKFLHWNYDSPQALAQGGNRSKFYWLQWKQVLLDFGTLIYKILRLITIPIRAIRFVTQKINSLKNRKHTHATSP
jgi:large-conductance mechanosensitive channel